MIYSGEEGHTLGVNYNFWGINEHFGGSSVHCGQILQKNPGKGQSPPFLAMPGFCVHTVLRNPEAARGNVQLSITPPPAGTQVGQEPASLHCIGLMLHICLGLAMLIAKLPKHAF